MADEQWQHLEVKDPVEHRTARQLNDAWASLPHAAQRGLSISSVPSAITRRCSLQLSRAGSHMRDHVESCKSRCSEVRAYKLDHLRRRRGSQAAYDQRHSRRRCGVGHGRRRSAKRASSRAFRLRVGGRRRRSVGLGQNPSTTRSRAIQNRVLFGHIPLSLLEYCTSARSTRRPPRRVGTSSPCPSTTA